MITSYASDGKIMSNVYNEFKKEIGYIDSTNQYIEMVSRIYERDYADKCIDQSAKSVSLNVSTRNESNALRIAKSYLISVHSCVEGFCLAYKSLPGSPTFQKNYSADNDGSRLSWTVKLCNIADGKKEIDALLTICEYYRLVRNETIHTGKDKSNTKLEKAKDVCKCDNILLFASKLNAPNDSEHVNFDDQVLFSRSALQLCKMIYLKSSYDSKEIYDAYGKQMRKSVSSVIDCKVKKETKIKAILSQYYPLESIMAFDSLLEMF